MEKAYDVYITKDYSLFKRLKGNRDIQESRINKITQSIQTVGWVHNPIIVNEKMEIVDGQGRFIALQRLDMPIEYIIAEGTGNEECISMNMNMSNWKLPDFIRSYAELGNINYQRLYTLVQNYADGSLDVIETAVHRVSKSKHRDIKSGSYQLTQEQYEKAIPRLEYADSIAKSLHTKQLPGSLVMLLQTIIYYYDYEEVDKDRLKHSIEKYIYGSRAWATNEDCENIVEGLYNYGIPIEKKIYISHLVKEERNRRKLELNKLNSERAFARTQKGVQGFITNTIDNDINNNNQEAN